jgi:hypothetical protein
MTLIQSSKETSPGSPLHKKALMSKSKVETFDCRGMSETTGSLCEARIVSQQVDPAPWQCALIQHFPSRAFVKSINCGPGTVHLLNRSCAVWLLSLPYHEESSQQTTFETGGIQDVTTAVLNDLRKNDVLKCFSSWKQCNLCVATGGNYFERDHCAFWNKIWYSAACECNPIISLLYCAGPAGPKLVSS